MNCYKYQLHGMVDSALSVNKIRPLIANNPVIAMDLIHYILESSRKQQILDILLQLPISLHLLHVVSQLTPVTSIPASFYAGFIDRSLKSIVLLKEESVQVGRKKGIELQTHLIQCFCYYLAGLYKNKKVDGSVPF